MQNQELLAELGQIVREDYGIDLSPEELFDVANVLTSFYEELIYGKEVEEIGNAQNQVAASNGTDQVETSG